MIFIVGNISGNDNYGIRYNVISHHDKITKQLIYELKDSDRTTIDQIENNRITQMQLWAGGVTIKDINYNYIIFYNDKIHHTIHFHDKNEYLENIISNYKAILRNWIIDKLFLE